MSRSFISVSFELKIKSVILESINNLGCKSILAHLLLCNPFDNSREMCQLSIRMVCSDKKFSNFWSPLDELSLEEILEDCTNEESKYDSVLLNKILFLKCFIDGKMINPMYKIHMEKNILGFHYMGANHPKLNTIG